MKCLHCGKEHAVQPLSPCPFCGKAMVPESLEGRLKLIYSRFGEEPFRNGHSLISIHADLMPDLPKDRRLLTMLVGCGGSGALLDALKKSPPEQSVAISRIAGRMQKDLLLQETAVQEVCSAFWLALGGSSEALKCFTPKPPPRKFPANAVCNLSSYEFRDNVLVKYTGSYPVILLPANITEIDALAFSGFFRGAPVEEVYIPEGVEKIGSLAFSNCRKLRKVSLPQSLHTIADHAFSGCRSLEAVTFPKSLHTIGKYVFSDCHALTDIALPASVRALPDGIFHSCGNLQTIHLPEGLERIGNGAFCGCKSLKSIALPKTLRYLDANVFAECEQLRHIIFPENLPELRWGTFSRCYGLTAVTLPEGMQKIEEYAFYKCKNLRSLTLPDSITEIHPNAFPHCSGITVHASQKWKQAHPDLLTRIP